MQRCEPAHLEATGALAGRGPRCGTLASAQPASIRIETVAHVGTPVTVNENATAHLDTCAKPQVYGKARRDDAAQTALLAGLVGAALLAWAIWGGDEDDKSAEHAHSRAIAPLVAQTGQNRRAQLAVNIGGKWVLRP